MTNEEIKKHRWDAENVGYYPPISRIIALCDEVLRLRAEVAEHEAVHDQQQAALAVEIARAEQAEARVAELDGKL